MSTDLARYHSLLGSIKARVQRAQLRAARSANQEMLQMYWDIGQLLHAQQEAEGWGAGVLRKLAKDLKAELPEAKGFSERNLKRMTQFFRAYPGLSSIGPQAVAQLESLILQLPWSHNIILLQRVKVPATRAWYAQQTLTEGWSRNTLEAMIKSEAHRRQGVEISNFELRLPSPQSDLARQSLKDPYLFDFLTLESGFREQELERGLIQHIERFLLELGAGFAFVGRQYQLSVGEDDFYLDLLFYHLKLRCFVVIELKVGAFKPEYVGKMNFYLNLVDDLLRHEHDNPSIGLILCQDKKTILAEYALRGLDKPIGVSEYELTRTLPESLESALPTIEAIEAELAGREESP